MPIERVVAVLTPVFAAVAAWLTGLLGAHLPGVNIDPSQIVALEVAGFTGATAAALKWLHGRSQFVQAEQQAKHDLDLAKKHVEAVEAANPAAGVAIADLEKLLKDHAADAEKALEEHVPGVVAQALAALFAQKASTPAEAAPAPPAPPAAPTVL